MADPEKKLPPVGLTLLLVDEQDSTTQRFKEDLITLGYTPVVVQIRSKVALITWLKDNMCDVVVANHRVENFEAKDVLRVLKDLNLAEAVPVILLSEPKFYHEIAYLLREGALDFISAKEVHRIVPIIEQELRRRRKFRLLEEKLKEDADQREVAATGLSVLQDQPHVPSIHVEK